MYFFVDAREETRIRGIPWKGKIAVSLASVATVGVEHPHGARCSDAEPVRPVANNGPIALMQPVKILCLIFGKDVVCVVEVTDTPEERPWV